MGFEKLKFREVVNGDRIEYFINNKQVEKNVYDKLMFDDSLYTFPPLPKVDKSPEDSCNINHDDEGDGFICEDCQELLDIISDLREMDDGEAIDALREYLNIVRAETQLETLIEVYSELGSSTSKLATRLEIELENFRSQFSDEED